MKLASFAPGIAPAPAVNVTPVVTPAVTPVTTVPDAGAAFASTVPAGATPAPAPAVVNAASGTLHGTGAASNGAPAAVRPSKTGTTAHGAQVYVDPGDDGVVVPMTGPSRKTLVAGAVGIALVSLSIGAVGAWRAVKASRVEVAPSVPITPETTVALLELPQALPHATGGSNGAARGGSSAGGRNTGGSGVGNGSASGGGGSASGGRNSASGGTGTGANGSSSANNGAASGGGGRNSASGTGETAAGGRNSAGSGSGTTPAGNSSASGGSGAAAGGSQSANSGSSGTGGTNAGSGSEGSGLAGPRGPAQNGFVEGDETDATGTLSPSAFRFVYTHYRAQIASCQSSVTRGGQEVRGIIRVRVRIGTDGHVIRTRVMENTTRNENLATCVQNQIRTWRYPAPEGGEVEVDYPLGFGN